MTRPDDVRAAVDAAVRHHLDARRAAPPTPVPAPPAEAGPAENPGAGRFSRAVLPADPPEGRCVIEPAVECTGCGHCRAQGY